MALTDPTAKREANRAAIVLNCMLKMVVQIHEFLPDRGKSSYLFVRYQVQILYPPAISRQTICNHLASGSHGCRAVGGDDRLLNPGKHPRRVPKRPNNRYGVDVADSRAPGDRKWVVRF